MSETPQHIAAELRRLSRKCEHFCNDPRAMMVQAAAVIEQMAEGLAAVTRERDEAYANVEDADRELKALRAEVERLRDAIKGLASRLPLLPNEPADDYVRGYSLGMRDAIKTISAALQEPTP